MREYGVPARIRTDNGAPFAGTGLLGLSTLSLGWMKLGIVQGWEIPLALRLLPPAFAWGRSACMYTPPPDLRAKASATAQGGSSHEHHRPLDCPMICTSEIVSVARKVS